MTLAQSVVAILFFRGEPVSFDELSTYLQSDTDALKAAVNDIRGLVTPTGLAVIESDTALELRTGADASLLIENIRKEELSKDLGKAALETLSILLYRGPSTRAEVDYIRGVNSTAILRNLMIRGLIEKEQNPSDQRSFLYKPSHDLFGHLGVQSVDEIPAYTDIQQELRAFDTESTREQESS